MYDEVSCELSYKPFYHLAEAVIRWCGLLEHETEILHTYLHAPHTFRSACSGLMKPDTHLGENARQIEVSDDQTTPLLYS